jgi:hypothetical protein
MGIAVEWFAKVLMSKSRKPGGQKSALAGGWDNVESGWSIPVQHEFSAPDEVRVGSRRERGNVIRLTSWGGHVIMVRLRGAGMIILKLARRPH